MINIMKKLFFIMLLCIVISIPLFSASPTILLGLGIKTFLMPDDGSDLYYDFLGNTHGLFSYRDTLGDKGYYSFIASTMCNVMEAPLDLYSDEEVISLETGFRFENSTLIVRGIFQSSITGTESDIPFFSPEWEVLYYFITERKKVQPFLSYQGYYFNESGSNEDIFYQGAEFGIKRRPAITRGYKVSIGIGWEHWPEYPVYSFPNTLSEESRNDILTMISGKLEGIFKYFLDWELLLSVIYRRSNAAMYFEESEYFISQSEDRIVTKLDITCEWSPSRYIHIKFHPFCAPVIYLYRNTLTASGNATDENLWSVTAGGDARIDWTPDNSFYVFFATKGFVYGTNELPDVNWNIEFHLGLEYSLRL